MSGNCRSSTRQSGGSTCHEFKNSRPEAKPHAAKPRVRNRRTNASRTDASSSTIAITGLNRTAKFTLIRSSEPVGYRTLGLFPGRATRRGSGRHGGHRCRSHRQGNTLHHAARYSRHCPVSGFGGQTITSTCATFSSVRRQGRKD